MSYLMIRPPESRAKEYRAAGVWRGVGPIGDLRRWRDESPQALAISAFGASGAPVLIDYRGYASLVERFSGALYELGVRQGHVVAIQLPNCWQALVLYQAVARLGAIVAPTMTTIRPRELERMLRRVEAHVCITVDRWAGFDHADALRDIASRLPKLRHRVVIGQARDGDIEFASMFEETAWEQRHSVALDDVRDDPDAVSMVIFTSGTTGEPKAALHTHNTVYTSFAGLCEALRFEQSDVVFCPHALMHLAGHLLAHTALTTGASIVLLDSWSGARGLQVMVESRTSRMMAAPVFIYDLLTATGERTGPNDLPPLRTMVTGATTVPAPLVADVQKVFGTPLQTLWAMTEVGIGTATRTDHPPDWAAHSDGSPLRSVELDLRSDDEINRENPGKLFIRSGGVCVATVGRDTGDVVVTSEFDDGWYETGDLAVPDGLDGIRLMGRAGDRIGGAFMIPVNDVESELLRHPGVQDVALVGYPDGQGGELACAVVVPAGTHQVILEELREYLGGLGMTYWYMPTRLVCVDALPRNGMGKVRKASLRRWLKGEVSLEDVLTDV
ncbi:AMP-binding protein [Mycobacterium sp. 852002-51057_SCH5723018]|uniref:AMP-binding protein n=1 Tax=Mycobacterium sp. 852002-51057_SCH5723018 TaxID=1834094 RepID=UPI0018D46406|nr:AMP-binding protein [Mycobacterium sp. 852002-51057_SCH5723018]